MLWMNGAPGEFVVDTKKNKTNKFAEYLESYFAVWGVLLHIAVLLGFILWSEGSLTFH